MRDTILLLGSQRSWQSVTMHILESHGVSLRVPSRLDPTGFLRGLHELHSLVVLNKLVYKHLFGSHEDGEAIPYREASRRILHSTGKGYATAENEYPNELLDYGCDLIRSCADLNVSGSVVALKYPAMVLCWDFWRQVFEWLERLPRFVLGISVRNPYEVALSYIVKSCVGFNHFTDVFGLLNGVYRSQLAVIEEYRHWNGFTVLPVRASSVFYRNDVERLVSTAGIPFNADVFNVHFQAKRTHDSGAQAPKPVFASYARLMEACGTL